MIFGYFVLAIALTISAVSAYYSIAGLTAIFAAAFWPIIIMGGALEVGKIATTVWLHKYWHQAAIRYKLYLVPAVAILMLITSMGIFGFLSKAHLDQAVPSGDVAAKVSLYDEKIQIQRENIKVARANLAQLDAAVNETMGRSTSEQGADKAVAIRRAQAKDRSKLMQEIEQSQKVITKLQEERAPIAAEQRKVEAEVGPIKYIAALIYDQGAAENADLLERAVRWVIILIVSVFDPLALVLILAATQTIEWERSDKRARTMDQVNDPEDEEPTIDSPDEFFRRGQEIARALDQQEEQLRAAQANALLAEIEPEPETEVFVEPDPDPEPLQKPKKLTEYITTIPGDATSPSHFGLGFVPQEALPESEPAIPSQLDVERPGDYLKTQLREQIAAKADSGHSTASSFGTSFPSRPDKGDTFLRVDYLPNKLFKFNGFKWIEIDRTASDAYAYDELYIQYLIEKISSGEYDIDDLTPAEYDQVTKYLNNKV